MDADSLEARSARSFLHGFSHLGTLRELGPFVVERGEGIYIFDARGRRYIEGNSGLWNVIAGFDHAGLIEAATEQLRRLPAYHAFFGRVSEPAIALAERLLEIAPVPMSKVFFTNSGSEANETAVKILWMIHRGRGQPARRKIISRKNAYHGVTAMTASLTGKDYVQAFGLPFPEALFADCPHHWRYGQAGEGEAEFTARISRNLEDLIVAEGPDTIAGFIADPVMGAGGVIPPPRGYFPAVQRVLRNHDIPLIADEVICGLGRTGMLWGSLTYDIKPDIVVTSKCLTAGFFPLGAVMISEAIHDALTEAAETFGEFPHGFTTGAHPVGSAIALKSLAVITEEGLFDNLVSVAPHFQERLRGFADHPLVGEARGVGLMGALEIVADKARKTPYSPQLGVGERIANTALQNGLIVRPIGDAVVIAPPFIISSKQIDELFDRVEASLDRVGEELPVTT